MAAPINEQPRDRGVDKPGKVTAQYRPGSPRHSRVEKLDPDSAGGGPLRGPGHRVPGSEKLTET